MINLLLSETKRSETYLKYLLKNKLKIVNIIYYATNKKNVSKIIESKSLSKKTFFVRSNTINSPLIEKTLSKIEQKIPIIYSGYSGEIIKSKKILNKNIIHFHPGDLPKYKGSTTFFYSLIFENKMTVSCFKMTGAIDEGEILYKKNFRKPSKLIKINSSFDDKMRAETMIEFLRKGKKKYKVKKNLKKFSIYYIAHPIIRGIAIHKNKLKHLYQLNDTWNKSKYIN